MRCWAIHSICLSEMSKNYNVAIVLGCTDLSKFNLFRKIVPENTCFYCQWELKSDRMSESLMDIISAGMTIDVGFKFRSAKRP